METNLRKNAIVKVLEMWEKQIKADTINDIPIQINPDGTCERGTGYNHQYPIKIWYNKYLTKKEILAQIPDESFFEKE